MADSGHDLSSVVFFQPQWIAMNGGWIHSNNVLFYFAQSPFFDRASANQTVIAQSQGIPEREFENLSTRQRFEIALSKQMGVQYIVEHDPLESKAKYKGPNGEEQSDVWVIRKQHRSVENAEEIVKVVGFYYVLNQAIFQAPSIASVFNYRMLNTTRAIDELFTTASRLPKFTVSHGHSYYRQVQGATGTAPGVARSNKEISPALDRQSSVTDKPESESVIDSKTTSNTDARLLRQALNMSMRYGKEYMDDMPLSGEHGNFRFARPKEAGGQLHVHQKGQANVSRVATPAPASRPASQPPTIQTDVPVVASKKSSAKTPTGSDPPKPKRRKSRIANSPISPAE